jgi:hypothetical protein
MSSQLPLLPTGMPAIQPPVLQVQPSTPAPEPVAPPAPAEPPLFMGKYKSEEDAKQGMYNLHEQNRQLQAQLQAVIAMGQNRPDPAQVRAERPNPWDRVTNEAAIPADIMREAVQFEIQNGVDARVKQYFDTNLAPQFAAMEARQQITKLHPDFETVSPAVEQFIAGNPAYTAIYNEGIQRGNILGTMDWAITRYKYERQNNPTTPNPQVQAERAAATLPNTIPARIAPNAQNMGVDQNQAAKQAALAAGDMRAYSRLVTQGFPLTYDEHMAARIAEALANRK